MSTQLNIPFDTSPGHTAANALTGHDPASFASLYDRNWAMVWRFAYLRTGDRHAAEDVLHDVFLALLKAAPTFQERGIPIEHWLLRVSNRCCTRWLYKNRWRKRFGFVRADSCEMPAQENCDIVCAVMRLPDELREVTLLHYIHSLPLAAVSSVIERPIGTVKSRLSRARAILNAELNLEIEHDHES